MITVSISILWYNEIKDRIPCLNPYFYVENINLLGNGIQAEIDVNEFLFNRVSKELGWM